MKKIYRKIGFFVLIINILFLIFTNSYAENTINSSLSTNLNSNLNSNLNANLSSNLNNNFDASFSNNLNNNVSSSLPDSLNISAEACSLLDVDSGKFLCGKNEYTKMYPASTTKLMTAIIVLEKCDDLSQKVNISYYAVHSVPYSYSIVNLFPNEQFSIKDLLNSLLIASANDSAFALAEYVANNGNNYALDASNDSKIAFQNSIQKFSDLMNQKAKSLGCVNTNFVNPNGIHNDNHYSTAHDLALIGKYAYNNSIIRNIVTKTSGELDNTNIYNGEKRVYSLTNLLLKKGASGYYQYANGLKTGYTDAAKYCIIASAQKNERNLIAVVLHSENTKNAETSRESDCKKLFEYGFNNFTSVKLVKANDTVKNLFILNGDKKSRNVKAICKNDISVLIQKGEALDVTPEIKINKFLAPISKGETLGTVTYSVYGENYTSDIIASDDVFPADYKYVVIILAILLLLLYLIFFVIIGKHRKNK